MFLRTLKILSVLVLLGGTGAMVLDPELSAKVITTSHDASVKVVTWMKAVTGNLLQSETAYTVNKDVLTSSPP